MQHTALDLTLHHLILSTLPPLAETSPFVHEQVVRTQPASRSWGGPGSSLLVLGVPTAKCKSGGLNNNKEGSKRLGGAALSGHEMQNKVRQRNKQISSFPLPSPCNQRKHVSYKF